MGMGGEIVSLQVVQARKMMQWQHWKLRVVGEHHIELDKQVSQLLQGDTQTSSSRSCVTDCLLMENWPIASGTQNKPIRLGGRGVLGKVVYAYCK